jgi:quercetin dioxygenase-like cupin family protein
MEKTSWEKIEAEPLNSGLSRQVLHGEKLSFARMQFKDGTIVPRHQHENEQLTVVTEGALQFRFDGREILVAKGEMILIPADVLHAAEAVGNSETLEIFAPCREDWKTKKDDYLRSKK